MSILHVPSFQGGVVLEGSADTQRVTELQEADSYDIGPRGQLVAASDLTDYVDLKDLQGAPAGWERVDGIFPWDDFGVTKMLIIGAGKNAAAARRYLRAFCAPSTDEGLQGSSVTVIPGGLAGDDPSSGFTTQGVYVSCVQFPYTNAAGTHLNPVLVCIGPREGAGPVYYPGLYILYRDAALNYQFVRADQFDFLGTGPLGEFAGGTLGKAITPRGITAYNSHVFGWGFDHPDTAFAVAPNRLAFSNAGKPLKWGDDNLQTSGNRAFSDTDAYLIGESDDVIRGAVPWAKMLAIGTARALFFLDGFGRDSFVVHQAAAGRRSVNIIGPTAMCEGPDGRLYGVDSRDGLWAYDGGLPDPVGAKLRDFRSKSHGWWDLIWTDPARAHTYPDPYRSNQDYVWMLSRPQLRQVWIGIPWCNATLGYGYGTDTVIIKYHVDTGGFTRQVFAGKIIRHGALVRRGTATDEAFLLLDQATSFHLKRYAKKATAATSPIMPSVLPKVTFGEYAPFGPNGVGALRRVPLTLAWDEAASLPLAFTATLSVDQQTVATYTLSIRSTAPAGPAQGDLWLDTSGSDAVIGVANSSPLHAAAADYVLKQWDAARAAWRHLPGAGGKGTRATIPLTFPGVKGTRVKLRLVCTTGTGRYQLEGLGQQPRPLKESV